MNIWLSASRASPGCAIDTEPIRWSRFLLNSATPIDLPLPASKPRPHHACFVMSRVCGSPNCTSWFGTMRRMRCPL